MNKFDHEKIAIALAIMALTLSAVAFVVNYNTMMLIRATQALNAQAQSLIQQIMLLQLQIR